MLTGFNEGRIIFGCYLEQSLKNKTLQKRTVTSSEYEVQPEMKLSMSLKELLTSSMTKGSLRAYLAESLLVHFHNSATSSVIVVYDTKINGRDFEEVNTHEEADTLILNQVLASAVEHPCNEVCVTQTSSFFSLILSLASQQT